LLFRALLLGSGFGTLSLLWPLTAWASGKGSSTTPIGSDPPASPLAYPLHPASRETLAISNLFWIILAESAVVFVFVVVVLFINILRFSAKKGREDEEPAQVYGNRRVEIAWTLIPAGILAAAMILTVVVMNTVNNPAEAAGPTINMDAIGHQWWWEFKYPQKGVVTANEIHIPVNTNIEFHITSVDVIHSFWIPQLSRQIDATPNIGTVSYVYANKPGVYPGACYEFCGKDHAWMQFRVVVDSPAKYAAWIAHMQRPAAQPTSVAAQNGEALFFGSTCSNCHTIDGTPANGKAAPNLTHEASRWGIAGGVLPMSRQNLQRWVRDPNSYKPGALMPAFNFGKKDLHDLSAFLAGLK
jgi:cytochrome c oxidase subunit 2